MHDPDEPILEKNGLNDSAKIIIYMMLYSLIYIGGDIGYIYKPSITMWSPAQLMSTCEVAKGENAGVLIENELVSSSQTSYCTLQ